MTATATVGLKCSSQAYKEVRDTMAREKRVVIYDEALL